MSCANQAIRAHSVQNSRVLDLLARDGHVKALSLKASKDNIEIVMEDVGRNKATTFEGFCSEHDSEIFRPIEENPIDISDERHLFLLAYRATVRELHVLMDAAIKIQATYGKRIELGLDTGNEPEPAGMFAINHILRAHSTYLYKDYLDRALQSQRYSDLLHRVITIHHKIPTIAVCSLYSIDNVQRDGDWVRVALNVFPISETASAVVFSCAPNDSELVSASLDRICNSEGHYQGYLVSRLILNNCENFVISPAYYDQWTAEKQKDVLSYFTKTLHVGDLDVENQHFYLF